MNVRTLLEDAEFLLQDRRFEGALLLVLVAIAATSKKRYPKLKKKDTPAFKRFIQDEIYTITPFVEMTADNEGGKRPLEHILYTILRCTVIHQGEMPPTLFFEEGNDWHIRPQNGGLVFSCNFITGLMRAVILAKENTDLFKDMASKWQAPWWPPKNGKIKTGPTVTGLKIHFAGNSGKPPRKP